MSQLESLESAMAKAKQRLTSWRATKSAGSPYPDEVLEALAQAARLGSPGDVCRRLNVGWYRVVDAMNDPRFRDACDDHIPATEATATLKTQEKTLSRQKGSDKDPCITFTQLVPVEMERQLKHPTSTASPAIEVAVGENMTIRLYDLSSAATTFLHNLALDVVREVRS